MEKHGYSEMPVMNKDSKFLGVVEQQKLTASIVLELVSQL